MNKYKSPLRKLTKLLNILPLAFLMIASISMYAQEPVKKESNSDEIFVVVDKLPEFPGGTTGLINWIGANIQYPATTRHLNEGKVIVNFIVEKDGTLSTIKIVRSLDPLLDAEAMRVVAQMPKWRPAELNGEAVRVRYVLPIIFRHAENITEEVMTENGPFSSSWEKQPQYPGGVKTLMEFIKTEMRYPQFAEIYGIQGRVITNFVIEKDGTLTDPRIDRGIDPLLDEEALRILKTMTAKWAPGEQNGKIVRVRFSLPIVFRLPKTDTAEIDWRELTPSSRLEKQTEFPGGTEALTKYLEENLHYQKGSMEKETDIKFIVHKDGSISDINIVEGFDSHLNSEVVRVISKMPKWEPGISEGEPVKVQFQLPIKFRIPTEVESQRRRIVVPEFNMKYEILRAKSSPSTTDNKGMDVMDKLPEYPGGIKAMLSFLGENTRKISIHGFQYQGRFITSFIVNKDGSISDIKIEKGFDKELGEEAVRIIEEMPKWNPGIENGEAVNVKVTMPIVFRHPN